MTKNTKKQPNQSKSRSPLIIVTIFLALGAALWIAYKYPRVNIPANLLGHPVVFIPNLLSEEDAQQLLELSKKEEFPTNAADLKFYKTLHEHIGEAQPIQPGGKCSDPFLVPSTDKTLCIFPGRIDVGRHFLLTGGVQGTKENYEDAASRLQSFGRYMFDLSNYTFMEKLFSRESFQSAAKRVCPTDKQILDPFQFNLILQVPGQTVALHIDGPYFWGASRFEMPQWLLAAMVFSNLFKEKFIDQVQVVAYFHTWNDTTGRDGDFVYWSENTPAPKEMKPYRLSGNSVDGSKVIHAASTYYSSRKAPVLDKSKNNLLKYIGNDEWHVLSDGKVINKYNTNELRMTVVYRARCFHSEEDRSLYRNKPEDPSMSLENVLQVFKKDLVQRGRLSEQQLQDITAYNLGLAIMDEYIKYPLPADVIIPYNYCVLGHLYPVIKPFLAYLGC